MKSKIFICALLLFIAGCENIPGQGGSSSSQSGSNVEDSKKQGDRITSALAAYRADKLAFPANLELLVPNYIPKIEPPLSGNGRWLYKTLEKGQRYILSFKGFGSESSEWSFDSQDNYWVCNRK
jgi:hypothetical protein